MELLWMPRAIASMRQTLEYIAAENPEAARSMLKRFHSKAELLKTTPYLGTQYGLRDVRKLTLGDYPYAVYYRVREQRIEILRVRHESRRPLPKRD